MFTVLILTFGGVTLGHTQTVRQPPARQQRQVSQQQPNNSPAAAQQPSSLQQQPGSYIVLRGRPHLRGLRNGRLPRRERTVPRRARSACPQASPESRHMHATPANREDVSQPRPTVKGLSV